MTLWINHIQLNKPHSHDINALQTLRFCFSKDSYEADELSPTHQRRIKRTRHL